MGTALRVLLADDDWLTVATMRMTLERAGFQVPGVARNGAEAVELAGSLRPDVVFMDVQMPVMDGVQATRTLMIQQPVCVVLVSGRECLTELAEQAGAMGCAPKPLFVEQLPALVAQAQERFQRFLQVAAEALDPEEALRKWTVLQRAVLALASALGVSEEQAFRRIDSDQAVRPARATADSRPAKPGARKNHPSNAAPSAA